MIGAGLKIWDRETGQLIRILEGHTGIVFSAAFSPDGTKIFTSSASVVGFGKNINRIWDISQRLEIEDYLKNKLTIKQGLLLWMIHNAKQNKRSLFLNQKLQEIFESFDWRIKIALSPHVV